MKKHIATTFFLLVVSMIAHSAMGQNFNLGLAMGYNKNFPGGDGVVLHLEPGYRLNENYRIGFRMELSLVEKEVDDFETSIDGGDWSLSFNAQRHMSFGNLTGFFGAGAGIYERAALSHPVAGHDEIKAQFHPVIYPRIGVSFRRLMLIAEYNFIPKSEQDVRFRELVVDINRRVEVQNSYFSLKVGVLIGR